MIISRIETYLRFIYIKLVLLINILAFLCVVPINFSVFYSATCVHIYVHTYC